MKNLLELKSPVSDNLEIIYCAKKHWIIYVIPILLIIVGIIGILPTIYGVGFVRLIGLALLYLLFRGVRSIIRIETSKIFLTKTHLTISTGLFGKTIYDISLQKLEGVALSQNMFGKMLNFGILTVSTGDLQQSYHLANPLELRNLLLKN